MCGCRAHSGSDLPRHAPGGGCSRQWAGGGCSRQWAVWSDMAAAAQSEGGATNCLNLELLSYLVGAKVGCRPPADPPAPLPSLASVPDPANLRDNGEIHTVRYW